MANFSTNSEFLAFLSCSPLSPSNLRISIIQQSYGLAIASTELCELVCFYNGFYNCLLSPRIWGNRAPFKAVLTAVDMKDAWKMRDTWWIRRYVVGT